MKIHLILIGLLLGISTRASAQNFWQSTGGPTETNINALAVSSIGDVYAGIYGGVYRTTDKGAQWTLVNSGINRELVQTVATNSNGLLFAGTGFGIYRSTDKGSTWTQCDVGGGSVNVKSLYANADGYMYAGTAPNGVMRSSNNGSSWLFANNGCATTVWSVVSNATGVLFAATYSGIFRSTDRGGNWTQSNAGITNISMEPLAIDSSGYVFAGSSGVFRSKDNGLNWTQVAVGVIGNLVRRIVVAPNGHLFAAEGGGRLFRSSDMGDTWAQLVLGVNLTKLSSMVVGPEGHLYLGTDAGVLVSSDDGGTWKPSNANLRTLVWTVGGDNETVYAGTSAGVYRSSDEGMTWIKSGLGVRSYCFYVDDQGSAYAGVYGGVYRTTNKGVDWTQIASVANLASSIVENSSGHLFVGTDWMGVYRSTDGGVNWNRINLGLPSRIYSLSINSQDVLFAATDGGAFRSTNNGTSWTLSSNGLPDAFIYAIATDSKGNLYASTSSAGSLRVFRSTDNGTQWIESSQGLKGNVYSLLVDRNDNIYAGTEVGVFVSTDYGISWDQLNSGLTQPNIQSLAANPRGRIFAGTWLGGVFRSADGTNLAPHPPQDLAASAGVGQVTLTWNKNNDQDFLRYRIYGGNSSSPTTRIDSTNAGSIDTSRVISSLTNGTTYYFRVTAVDSAGNESGYSNEVSATPSSPATDLVRVTGGTFQMGSTTGNSDEIPVHSVTLGGFYIDKTEITSEKWTEVRIWGLAHGYSDLPAGQNGYNPVGSNNPVTSVGWHNTLKWCNARSEKDGLTPVYYTDNTLATIYRTGDLDLASDAVKWTAKGYRLPTEAEWEFAARGGTKSQGKTYSGSNTIDSVAWYVANSNNSTHPVGSKGANELGICDMSGNVWEWCWDGYGTYDASSQTDPKGPSSGRRVFRGGGFYDSENVDDCRVANRWAQNPDQRLNYLGFRCVQTDSAPTTGSIPAAPQNLTATAGNAQVALRWNKVPDTDLKRYRIYRGTASPANTLIDSSSAGNLNDTTKTISGLTNGTTYYFRVKAVDSAGNESGYSNEVGATPSSVTTALVRVIGGTFQMGSTTGGINETPVHSVTLSAFYTDKTEITYEKWTEVRNWGLTHGYTDLVTGRNGYNGTTNHPVTEVSWYDILKWCNARSEKDGLTPAYYTSNTLSTAYRSGQVDLAADAVKWTANGYRLPTEAEWEFAARGGTKSQGYTYSGSNTIDGVAWNDQNSGTNTHPVATKGANELDLYDMSGNVWEWCWDWYGTYGASSQADPRGPSSGTDRVLRGGSFGSDFGGCRLASRSIVRPVVRGNYGGFRCVQTDSIQTTTNLVRVTGGTFQMGSNTGDADETPVHLASVGAFYIDKTEITYENWTDVRAWGLTHGYTDLVAARNLYPSTTNQPVQEVSWYDILKWCNARSEKDGATPAYYSSNTLSTVYRTGQLDVAADAVKWTANGYRLPTEAEWEFAARGGTKSQGYSYSGSNIIDDVAWCSANSDGNTHPVGTKGGNELGLYDLSGNVWEWCWDWYGIYSSTAQADPKGPTSGTSRVLRGGSVGSDFDCRVAGRVGYGPGYRLGQFGFRCVQTEITTTGQLPPTVSTSAASSVSAGSATLNGSVNPNGSSANSYFEWDTGSTLSTYSATASQSIGSGTSAVSVAANLTGLNQNTTYYYRVVGQNGAGTQKGTIETFTTSVALPGVAVLSSPLNATTGLALNPTLTWNAVQGAVRYTLQVSLDTSFVAKIFEDSMLIGTSQNLSTLSSNTVYYWRVSASNEAGYGSYSQRWSFRTIVLPPAQPSLSAPSDGSTSVLTMPTLRWGALAGIDSYHLQVSTVSSFATLFFNDSGLVANQQRVGPLAPNTTYYWRVRGKNLAGYGSYSPVWSFSTLDLPERIVLSSPLNGAVGIGTTATLAWASVTGADQYHLQVSMNANLSQPIVDDSTVASNSQIVGPLNGGVTYFWRVRAMNGAGYGLFSTTWSFTTATAIPSMATLVSPLNGAIGVLTNPLLVWSSAGGADFYQLQVSTSSSFAATIINDTALTSTSQGLVGLANNTTYYWRARAKNALGYGPYSPTWSFTTIGTQPSSAPQLSSPAKSVINVPLSVVLSWSQVAGADFYHLEVSMDSLFSVAALSDTTISGTFKQVSSLFGNTTYYWRVRGKNAGGYGPYSAVWSFTTIMVPPSSAVTLASPQNGGTKISTTPTLTWSSLTDATTYHLQFSTTSSFSTTIVDDTTLTTTLRQLPSLQNNTLYYWRVRGKNDGGYGPYSQSWSFTTIVAAPSTAVTLTAPQDGSTKVSISPALSWSSLTDVTGYHLQVATTPSFSSSIVDDTALVVTTKQLSGLQSNTTYYWRVRGRNEGGYGPYSPVWSFTTIVALPAAASLSSPSNTAVSIPVAPTLTWGTLTGATSYHLQVSASSSLTPTIIDDTALTVTSRQISGLQNSTIYYWRVRGKNDAGYGPFSTTWSFTTIVATPSAVSLVSPSNAAAGISINPTLTWSAMTGVTTYHLQVSGNPSFAPNLLDDTTLTGTTKQLGALQNNTIYYWRIRGRNEGGYGPYSLIWSFTTIPVYTQTLPVTTSLTFATKTKANEYTAQEYRLIGLPGSSDILAKDIVTGVQNEDWEIVWDNGAASDYLKRYDGSADFKFSVGKAFWIISKSPLSIARTVPSASLNAAQEVEIPVRSGWNLVTNPFDKSVPWTRIQTTNGITGAIYSFNGAFNNATTLDPYAGYYFFNGTPSPVLTILRVPFSSAFGKLTELEVKKENGWRVSIEVSTGGETPALSEAASGRVEGEDVRSKTESGKSETLALSEAASGRVEGLDVRRETEGVMRERIEIGVADDAFDGLDSYDQRMPRSLAKAGVYFDRPNWDDAYREFGEDIRSESIRLKKWEFTVEGELLETKIIRVTGIESIPSTEEVFLVDKERSLVVDLRGRQEYITEMVKGKMTFEILVGRRETVDEETKKLVPTEIKVGPNYPNPFNPETIIPIELPKAMGVKITIYDILGRQIRTLFDGTMDRGRYYIRWDGKDEQQRKLASGAYLLRIEMPRKAYVQRMLLLQ